MNEMLHKNVKRLANDFSDYFNDVNILWNMYEKKFGAIKGERSYDFKVELEIDIIENEIVWILEKKIDDRTEQERRILNNARIFYSKLFRKMELVAISCKLYDDKILAKKFFLPRIVEEIVSYKIGVKNSAYSYCKKFLNNERLDDDSQMLMFEYFTSKIGLSIDWDNVHRNIIKKLLEQAENYHITGKRFYLQFISHEKCSRLGLTDAKIYFDNNFNSNNNNVRLGRFSRTFKSIVLQESLAKINPRYIFRNFGISYDMLLALVVNHELQHYAQTIYAESGVINKSAIVMIKNILFSRYLSTKNFDEYHINYDYRETEREADIKAWKETELFFKEYAGKFRKKDISAIADNVIMTLFEQAYSYQKINTNERKRLQTLEKYNIENLKDVIAEHPQELNRYPQLKLFFYDDGKLKEIETLIREYTRIILDQNKSDEEHKNYEDVYQEFFDYYFMTIDLEKMFLKGLNTNEQMELFILIGMAYEREIKKLSMMIDIYSDEKRNYFKVIGKRRIRRIKKYYDYLNMHQNTIVELEKEANISNLGLLTMDSLNTHLKLLEERFDFVVNLFSKIRLDQNTASSLELIGKDSEKINNGSRKV